MAEKMWMVRAGGGYLFEEFIKNDLVAIGWDKLGDLSNTKAEQIKDMVRASYPDYSKGKLAMTAGQFVRFRFELIKGSYVATYNPETRRYKVGKIVQDYEYQNQPQIQGYPHVHKVRWEWDVERDSLSVKTKNYLGAIMTLFEITEEPKTEILNVIHGKTTATEAVKEEDTEQIEALKEDTVERSKEFIKDKLTLLDAYDMQDLVAGILRSMGYKTLVSPKGSDRGKDIVASPDGLGLEDPKILVEVKHREGKMGAPDIASFMGRLRKAKGIYVSTGGFSKEAHYEAERAENPITLIDFDLLIQLIIDNYDKFDSETKELIPLKKIYWLE